jgi:RNA polymerase sigma factor (sigma-70 family)
MKLTPAQQDLVINGHPGSPGKPQTWVEQSARRFTSRLTREQIGTLDLEQEAWIGMIHAAANWVDDGRSMFRTYAFICMRNQIRSAVRRHEAMPGELVGDVAGPDRGPHFDTEAFWTEAAPLRKFLTPRMNEFLRLRCVEGLTERRLAHRFGLSRQRVTQILKAARRRVARARRPELSAA